MKEPAQLTYLARVRETLDRIERTQAGAIVEGSDLCAESILRDGLVHLFGSGHSRMAVEEMYSRYGSFPGFHSFVGQSLSYHHQVVGCNVQRRAMLILTV